MINYNQNLLNIYKYNNIHLDYLLYRKDIHFYKVMDGFVLKEEEEKFIMKNINIPFWFSSIFNAYNAFSARLGGINSYKVINTSKILVVNYNNIKKIIKLVQDNESDKIFFRNKNHDKNYILDLLRLSSCSEQGLLHQIKIYNLFNNYKNELWLTKNPYPYYRPDFLDFKQQAEHNYDKNINIINKILAEKPKIIVLYTTLTINSPEIKILLNNGYETHNINSDIFFNNSYIVLTNIKYKLIDVLDYNMSYYLPYVIIV